MGTLNLGSAQISSSGNTLVSSSNLNLSGDWVNAPSGTIITTATGELGTAFSTSSDSGVDTGLTTSALVRKLPGGTGAGTSKIIITCTGGCRSADSSSGQDVTELHRSINGASYSFLDYMDSQYRGDTYWLPHSGMYIDTVPNSAGASHVYKMYQRSRGAGTTIHFNLVVGGVTGAVYLIAQEVVN